MTLSDLTPELTELKQAVALHRATSRKGEPFPSAIVANAMALTDLGLSADTLARATALSPSVIYGWLRRNGKIPPKKPARSPKPQVFTVAPPSTADLRETSSPLHLKLGSFDVTIATGQMP